MRHSARKVLVIDDRPETGRLVEKGLLGAGYSVCLAGSGANALPEALKFEPDLILLDYTLGDEGSIKVFELLTSRKQLPAIPLILIAAQDDMVREVHRGLESVVHVLPRPVGEEALLAAVERAIGQSGKAAAESDSIELLIEEIQRASSCETQVAWDPEAADFREVSRAIRCRLREKVLAGIIEGRELSRDKLARAITEQVLSPGFLQKLARELYELVLGPGKQGFVAGARTVSFSDLLQSLTNSRSTGVLTVAGARNLVEIHLAAGAICFLNPRQISLRFSQETIYCSYCAFSNSYVGETLEKTRSEDDSIFFRMLAEKVLQKEQLTDLMVSLGLEVLRECVSDQASCWFQFRPRPLGARFLEHNADLPVQGFLLKLFSHLDEWNMVEREVYDTQAFSRTDKAPEKEGENAPSEKQAAVLAALDGPRTILEICEACRLSPFQVCRGLARLLGLGLIQKTPPEGQASAPAAAPPSRA